MNAVTSVFAARRLQFRRELRKDYGVWCRSALEPQGFVPAMHHRLIIDELKKVALGETLKLMLLLPPGSAKTTYGSFLYPPWLMALGGKKVLAGSHTIKRAVYVSKQVQRYVRNNSGNLGYGLENEAVEQWATSNDSEYMAAGVGTGIAGFRADLGLIDDPVKNRQDADSPAMQETVWNWYWDDFFTRLKPGASQVLIMTRWAEGDLGGRLEETEGDTWRILRLPAIAETNDPLGRAPGEWLWSDDDYGFGEKMRTDHEAFTRAGRTREWSALYQQRPVPESGDYFRKEWLRPVESLPPRSSLRVFMGSDYAVTQDGGDYTVHIVVGLDADDRMYVLDLWREQTSSDKWVNAFCDLVIRWKPLGAAEETGQIKSAVGPWLARTQLERKAFVARTGFATNKGDKAVRAQSIRGRMASLGLYVPVNAPWRLAFEAELLSFPAGRNDDQVDALGLIGQLLDKMFPPEKDKDPLPKEDSWTKAFRRAEVDADDNWKVS